MEKDIRTNRIRIIQKIIDLVPIRIRRMLNPDRRAIELFMLSASFKIKKDALILDAGAGPAPYKFFFTHTKYESTDFSHSPYKNNKIDFTCNLQKIPKPKNNYDVIICTEVLEHLEYPQKALNEFFRILKKGGKLFLTTSQGRELHQEPYNFFYFTKYGLESLLKNAGFKEYKITSKGGFFWFLSDAIRFNRLIVPLKKNNNFFYYLLAIIGYPFTQIIIPLILFPFDYLDKQKKWTTGYLVEAKK
jgi:SAM-dependent methyltransferase